MLLACSKKQGQGGHHRPHCQAWNGPLQLSRLRPQPEPARFVPDSTNDGIPTFVVWDRGRKPTPPRRTISPCIISRARSLLFVSVCVCVCVALSVILWCTCIRVFCLWVSIILCSPLLCHISITISSLYLLFLYTCIHHCLYHTFPFHELFLVTAFTF